MKLILTTALCLAAPLAASALPAVGDQIGTDPATATTALEAAGCMGPKFEAEDGKIEAKCHDAAGARWEIYIDPQSGAVAQVKADD
ncbi:PepSY domain-containing protein [Pseudooceanicola sp. 200-1SW]|uniref:PepSY domain-containing protein n=1 Tax=Pseudooceanicola sp. 200-1SW TaxID=3425949 RepID=UPI003D7F316C